MFYDVLNHASSKRPQIQKMLNGNPESKDVAVAFKSPDYKQHILTMANVTNSVVQSDIFLNEVGIEWKNW